MPERSEFFRRLTVWCLAVTAASLPLYVVRFHVGPLPSTPLEAMVGVTVVTYLLSLWTGRRLPASRTALDIPILLFLVAGIGGVVFAPDHTKALGIYRAYLLEAVVIFYVAVDTIRTRHDLRVFLLVAGVGSSAFAVGQMGRFAIAAAAHAIYVDDAPAFLNTSANAVAMYLEPPFALAIGFILFSTGRRDRWIAILYAALMLTGIILSLSRASYLALAVFAVMVVVSIPQPRWRLAAVAATALIVLSITLLPFISQRLGTLAHSAQLRTSIYGQALQMLSHRPIQGAGISGFPIRVAPFRPSSQEIELYPHNLWLTTWSELGLLGVISFAVIFFGLMWRGFRSFAKSTGLARPMVWGATGAFVLYFVHGMFDSPYWKNDLSVEFWYLAALMVIAVRGARDQSLADPALHRASSSS